MKHRSYKSVYITRGQGSYFKLPALTNFSFTYNYVLVESIACMMRIFFLRQFVTNKVD